MRSTPPAVEITLASGRREQGLVAAVHAVAAALVGAWLGARGGGPVLAAWPIAAMLGAGLGLKAFRPMRGSLRWDGQCWWHVPHTGAAHPLHRVDLMMDLGGWVLLRARAEQAPGRLVPEGWCGVSRRDAGSGWHALRVALYQGPTSAPAALAVPSGRASG
jgi:hypothetical protein